MRFGQPAEADRAREVLDQPPTTPGHWLGSRALDEAYAAAATEVEPGQYVMIAVADTGTGISREIAEKVFEPFSVSSRILRAAKWSAPLE